MSVLRARTGRQGTVENSDLEPSQVGESRLSILEKSAICTLFCGPSVLSGIS